MGPEPGCILCAAGRAFREAAGSFGRRHKASFGHFQRSQLELLRGVRSFLDEEIGHYERWMTRQERPRTEKIRVE